MVTGGQYIDQARSATFEQLKAAHNAAPAELATARNVPKTAQAAEQAVHERAGLLRAHAAKVADERDALQKTVDEALWSGNNVTTTTATKLDALKRQHEQLLSAAVHGERGLPALELATLKARIDLNEAEQRYFVARQLTAIRDLIEAHDRLCAVDPAASPVLELTEDSLPAQLARAVNERLTALYQLQDSYRELKKEGDNLGPVTGN